jgi:hypothetical protein
MGYMHEHVFDPILGSDRASNSLKQGVKLTILRINERDARGMLQYYWSAIHGTERSIRFADLMRQEGFSRFEDPGILDEFRRRFNDNWLTL